MSAGSGEPMKIGPALRESVAVGLRHWPIALLTIGGIWVWSLLLLFAIGRSWTSPAGVSSAGFAIWFGVRFMAWLVLGALAYRILTVEADVTRTVAGPRDPRQRLYLACVLCFASLSIVSFVVWLGLRMGMGVAEVEIDIDSNLLSVPYLAALALTNLVWAYIDARFALFALSLLRDRGEGGFGRGWAAGAGNRARLFLLFLIMELPLNIANEAVFRGTRHIIDLEPTALWLSRWSHYAQGDVDVLLGLFVYPLSAVVSAALHGGAFVAIFRRLTVSEVQVFD